MSHGMTGLPTYQLVDRPALTKGPLVPLNDTSLEAYAEGFKPALIHWTVS